MLNRIQLCVGREFQLGTKRDLSYVLSRRMTLPGEIQGGRVSFRIAIAESSILPSITKTIGSKGPIFFYKIKVDSTLTKLYNRHLNDSLLQRER